MEELRFTLEGGVDFTGNVLIEIASARGVTVHEARELGSKGAISFEELEQAVSSAAVIQHAREAVTYNKVKSEWEEEKANHEALKMRADRMKEALQPDLLITGRENPADFMSYVSDITKPIILSNTEDTEIKITKPVETIEAGSDSVVIFRSATNRWEKVSYWSEDDQSLADLLLTQKIIEKAIVNAKLNSRWGL